MSTPMPDHANHHEEHPIATPESQTTQPVPPASATLLPTAENMSMEHIFFSLRHLESRMAHLEQHNTETEETGTTSHQLEDAQEQEIRRLWNTIHTMQLAHQALNTQFEKITATLAAFNRQLEESLEIYGTMRTMLTSLRGLVEQNQSDSVPSNWRSMYVIDCLI